MIQYKKNLLMIIIACIMMMIPWSVNSQSLKGQAPTPLMGWNSWNWFQRKNLRDGQKAVILLNRAPENSAIIFPT
jgi:hypothetical protein